MLNYHGASACRKKGWVDDAFLLSHIASSTASEYEPEIGVALEALVGYDNVLGYAHSTGAPILLNYLMQHGDGAFDAFIFNSPFLDFGHVGGEMVEVVLEAASTGFQKIGLWDHDEMLGTKVTPKEYSMPLRHLGRDVVMSAWSAKLWSLYYFDWECRPLYSVPATAGYISAMSKCHARMREEFEGAKKSITTKPFLCISSRADDVLESVETFQKADIIGSSRTEVELGNNAHDVFLSSEEADTVMAIDYVKVWLKHYWADGQ